jgi:tetratricopeptide (TPR) repeat protein
MNDTTAGNRRAEGDSLDPALEGLLREQVEDWTKGSPRPLRAYLEREPGLGGRPEVVVELVNQEIVLRRMRGETPRPADYLAEFPELTESLQRLFEVHALASGTLETADGTLVQSPLHMPFVPRHAGAGPPEIPGYYIESYLGRGGMGVVYLARHHGLNRRVALKLLPESRQDDAGLVARFRREAEAAARCQHPNLVQIHDVGEHAGELYLALEYVAGGHLGRAMAGEPQPPRRAAELVETLARAIDHAHAQGVVHRDLKPANVLLTADGQPKITDFGLAKLKDSSTQTEVGTMLGTLAYMAPEQVQARSADVGPRTDIHALGAILYEALTGRPPYRGETPERILHAILSEEVVAPSARQPGVPRDLEAVCLKCLEKEPSRRYATAADLAEDLRRFLDGRPTAARRASAAERCLRWCRRNRGAVAAMAALLLLTTISAWQAVRATAAEWSARTERDRAETAAETSRAVTEFLNEDILGEASAYNQARFERAPDADLKVRTALDIATEKIGERFKGRPLVEAAIRYTIAEAYRELGLFAQARPHLDRVIELRSKLLGEDDPQTLIAKCRLGLLLMQEKPDEAERYLVSAREGLLAARGIADPETLIGMQALGCFYVTRGQVAKGRELLSQAMDGLRAVRGPAHPDTLDAVQDLAMAYVVQGDPEQTRRVLKESIRLLEEPVGNEQPAALDARFRLANVFAGLGDLPEAIRLLKDVLPVQQRVLGDGHHSTLLTMAMLSQYHQVANRGDEAEPLLLKALPECRKTFDRNHAITDVVLAYLSVYYAVKGDLDKVRQYLPESQEMTRALYGPDDALTDEANRAVGALYLRTGEYAAERYLHDHLAYTIQRNPEAAERYLTEGKIGLCLLRRKANADAERSLRRASDWIAQRIPDVPPAVLAEFKAFENGVIQFHEETGNKDQAAIWKMRRADLDFPAEALAP